MVPALNHGLNKSNPTPQPDDGKSKGYYSKANKQQLRLQILDSLNNFR
jgi:hypothetical protein